MLNEMTVSDSEKIMLEIMRETGLTPDNVAQMARSHAIKIKSYDAENYDKLANTLARRK
ncbi:hypothetical protein [Paenibacillus macerans]|uniref:hypothetical protein n=1 Tax=Paenibacillus macerans TaxID=44252 RepID=UPI0020423AC2|nr:hypothetical protein [Paenibacillus macerans]MCM3699176.1 hypothetical protein [Paenibacillus macerans]